MRRFWGAGVALSFLLLVLIGYWYTRNGEVEEELQPEIFQFESDQLTGIKVVRPDLTIDLQEVDGTWQIVGQTWRPSRSMVRRVSHQLHDLTARAVVAESAENLAEYGLGTGSIQVVLTMRNGETISFEAGDPNPTSVSWYIRPMPGDDVFVVKKSAIDYFRLSLSHFRETRVGVIDANEAERVEASVDGRAIDVVKVGTKTWEMKQPISQRADRQEVRTMLGRTGALKASEFVADAPGDLSKWGLEPAPHWVKITMSGDRVVSLRVAEPTEEEGRPMTYVYREEDDSVYRVKGGFLEAFRKPAEAYRDRRILGHREWDVKAVTVVKEDETVVIRNSSGGWRWEDDALVSGATARRLSSLVTSQKALAFHDKGVQDGDFESVGIRLMFANDKETFEFNLGKKWEILPDKPEDVMARPDRRQYLKLMGTETVYEIDWSLSDVVDDLVREYGRKKEKDAEKSLQLPGEDDAG